MTVKATLASPCKVRFRVPQRSGSAGSLPAVSQAGSLRSQGGWIEVEGRAGENAWLLRFGLSSRLVEWTASAALCLDCAPVGHLLEWEP